jgi:uncharacterized protein
MALEDDIAEFLAGGPYAVAGASNLRHKYGNRVLRCYLQHGLVAYPVNPREALIEGRKCYPDLESLPEPVRGLSIITPPSITEGLVEDAARASIPRVWMQPGAESSKAIARARALGLTVIAGGPCLLVALGFRG